MSTYHDYFLDFFVVFGFDLDFSVLSLPFLSLAFSVDFLGFVSFTSLVFLSLVAFLSLDFDSLSFLSLTSFPDSFF
jgi:hypothetical protein